MQPVFGLATRSLRTRAGAFTTSFLMMFFGATILMAFASLLDTAAAAGVSEPSEATLTATATAVVGWGLLPVAYGATATLTLAVRRRGSEIDLLKSLGATRAQIGRMIVGEAAVVSVAAAALAVLPAMPAGRALLWLLVDSGQVADSVPYVFGPTALTLGAGVTLGAALAAATLAARRATRTRTPFRPSPARDDGRMSRERKVAAGGCLSVGLAHGTVTATVMNGESSDTMMQTAGQASLWFAIGLALMGPFLVRTVIAELAAPLARLGGASGYLALRNVRRRAHRTANALTPVILFTGVATGALVTCGVESEAAAAEGIVKSASDRNIETLNVVVIGIVAVLACMMLVNTMVAATTHRGREFGQHRLIGTTPEQVLWMVGLESAVLALAGVVFGTLAGAVTVVPYTIARTDEVLPDTGLGLWLGVVAVAVLATLASAIGTARRTLRTAAVETVAPTA
ncbi:ABC transporter permease [Streptomyces sp. H27-D2]|uniref:ABC transporter permease n=1 Tax=Streptomyces sp. H27-D2 TaxID=3046304 RepID=UPI002DBAC9CE|nr:ABC transporter permease [Streptomyces sp. H27-D2]MEC4014907.1 ABC transporter permease [Streptomyces sp. H27-D2]